MERKELFQRSLFLIFGVATAIGITATLMHFHRPPATVATNPAGLATLDEYPEAAKLQLIIDDTNKNEEINEIDTILAADYAHYQNPVYEDFVKSLSYSARADARAALKMPDRDVFADRMKAAELGSTSDIFPMAQKLTEAGVGSSAGLGITVTQSLIDSYVRTAAALGSLYAMDQLQSRKAGSIKDPSEVIFWQLSYILRRAGSETDRVRHITPLFFVDGADAINQALRQYSPAGGPIGSNSSRLPGRGELTTIYMILMMQNYLERRSPVFDRAKAEAGIPSSARDNLKYLNQDYSSRSMKTRVYLITREPDPKADQFVVTLPAQAFLDNIFAGDGLYVRCGALAHFGVVWRLDKAKKEIYLRDDLFEFWQPSHNECISHFALVPIGPGRYLVKLAYDEVLPMIEAIQTLRDDRNKDSEDTEQYLSHQPGQLR